MANSQKRRGIFGTLRQGLILTGCLSLFATPAAAQGMGGMGGMGGWEPTLGHIARSLAHFIGIAGGLVIFYLAANLRRQTKGSTVGKSSLIVAIGTLMFVLVFISMEAMHAFGRNFWYFADTDMVRKTWWMIGLTLVIGSYSMSYRYLVEKVGV